MHEGQFEFNVITVRPDRFHEPLFGIDIPLSGLGLAENGALGNLSGLLPLREDMEFELNVDRELRIANGFLYRENGSPSPVNQFSLDAGQRQPPCRQQHQYVVEEVG